MRHRFLPFLAAAALISSHLLAQQPAPPPTADPTKKNVPAEIVPAKPETRPPAGGLRDATPPAQPLSPGTQPPPPRPQDAPLNTVIGALPEADLEKILSELRRRYVSPEALAELELKRSTVLGVLERLAPGATVTTAPPAPPEALPFRAEILEQRAGYLRAGSLTKENLAELDKALADFAGKNLAACILDLRATPPGTDFEMAAETCRRFVPKGQVLFTVHRQGPAQEQIHTSKTDPRHRGLLIVLTDADTAGTAEVVAGALRSLAKAILIGQRTKGEAAEFTETPLSGGHLLRFAVAEARLPGGESILTGGVTPDLPVEMPPDAIAAVLKQELEKGVAPLLTEPERPRMNEAALVAGTNPEIDALQAAQRLRGDRPKPLLRDQMILRALDLITTLSALKKP